MVYKFAKTVLITGFLGYAAWLFAGSSFANPAQTLQQQKAPIVIELFTSQSCSSCPPADKLLTRLAENEHVIALSCHVTYWNHLHWKDTLSREDCTQRQRAYSAAHNRNNVFTPQMLINGQYSAVGSRSSDVDTQIKKAQAQQTPILPIKIRKDEGHYSIEISPTISNRMANNGNATITAFFYKNAYFQAIKSGENRGLKQQYIHPVVDIQSLKNTSNTSGQSLKNITTNIPHDHVAVLIQDKQNGTIWAAGKL